MSPKCASCGSERLVHRARLLKTQSVLPAEVVLEMPPIGLPGTERYRSEIRADACIDCGHIQIHAQDLTALREAYERQQAESLHLA